jgi:uncharacterized protein (DUF736 family)
MTKQQYDNTGVIFKNEDKQSEKHADYRGQATVDGVDYWLDGWTRVSSRNGNRFISFKLKPKQPTTAAKPDFNSEMPF